MDLSFPKAKFGNLILLGTTFLQIMEQELFFEDQSKRDFLSKIATNLCPLCSTENVSFDFLAPVYMVLKVF